MGKAKVDGTDADNLGLNRNRFRVLNDSRWIRKRVIERQCMEGDILLFMIPEMPVNIVRF